MTKNFSIPQAAKTALITFLAGAPITYAALSPSPISQKLPVPQKQEYVQSVSNQYPASAQMQNKTLTKTTAKPQEKPSTSHPRLILDRTDFTDKSTIGTLYLDTNNNRRVDDKDEKLAHTLELPYRNNERNISSIPEGSYEIARENHPKFGMCYRLQSVPGRSGVLIHYGNFPKDTQGCPLVGETKAKDAVYQSRTAIKKITKRFDKAILQVQGRK